MFVFNSNTSNIMSVSFLVNVLIIKYFVEVIICNLKLFVADFICCNLLIFILLLRCGGVVSLR